MAEVWNEDTQEFENDGSGGGSSWFSADSLSKWLGVAGQGYQAYTNATRPAPRAAPRVVIPTATAAPTDWKKFLIPGVIALVVLVGLGIVFKSKR